MESIDRFDVGRLPYSIKVLLENVLRLEDGENVTRASVERNKVEIAVAPIQQRLLAHFALASPGIAVKTASGSAGQKAAANVAKGQFDKR